MIVSLTWLVLLSSYRDLLCITCLCNASDITLQYQVANIAYSEIGLFVVTVIHFLYHTMFEKLI